MDENFSLGMKNSNPAAMAVADINKFMAIVIRLSLTNMSFEDSVSIVKGLGHAVQKISSMDTIRTHISTFRLLQRSEDGDIVWFYFKAGF